MRSEATRDAEPVRVISRVGVGLFVFALALVFLHQRLFFSAEITIEVVQNDAVPVCRAGGVGKLGRNIWPTQREGRPDHGFLGYCGAILTDRGYYKLPEDEPLNLDASRAELHGALREGCRYRVLVIGYGRVLEPGDRPRVPIRQRISRIVEPLGCEDDGTG